jgi:hypothetical protein
VVWWLGVLGLGYLGLLVAVALLQDTLVFPGAGRGRGVPLPSVQGVEVTRLARPDGEQFRVALGDARGARVGIMLFFVGNGEDLRSGMFWAAELARYQVDTVVVEYPGYGDSDGAPSYDSLTDAAETAWRFAVERAGEAGLPLFVGGSSLGTFLAVHVAALGGVAKLLLLAPPTSLVEAGGRRFPFLPVAWLLRHRFDSMALADRVACPALVVQGADDTVVPVAMGRGVARALGARFLIAPGAGHDRMPLVPGGPFEAQIRAFLRSSR